MRMRRSNNPIFSRPVNVPYFGELTRWDVSGVTDMSYLFQNKTSFNDNIINWNVSGVTDFTSMFDGVTSFNRYIFNWVISNSNATNMFKDATAFINIIP